MWIAVAVTAVWGSVYVGSSNDERHSQTIPSGIFVGLFATIGTWALAKYAFGRDERSIGLPLVRGLVGARGRE